MTMFPGRFPNEILENLDIALLMKVIRVRKVEEIESKRTQFLKLGTALEAEDWIAIKEHDALMSETTMRVETDGVGT